jgi:hypothetical protein
MNRKLIFLASIFGLSLLIGACETTEPTTDPQATPPAGTTTPPAGTTTPPATPGTTP